jgi:hypothetical protein
VQTNSPYGGVVQGGRNLFVWHTVLRVADEMKFCWSFRSSNR